MAQRPFLRVTGQWVALAACAVLGAAMHRFVDLEPQVDADFFFASDDPQFAQTRRIDEIFGAPEPVFVALSADTLFTRATLLKLRDLSEALGAIEGVASVSRITHWTGRSRQGSRAPTPKESSRTFTTAPSGRSAIRTGASAASCCACARPSALSGARPSSRARALAAQHGFEPELTGGLFVVQGAAFLVGTLITSRATASVLSQLSARQSPRRPLLSQDEALGRAHGGDPYIVVA
jgi:hypothetical protein